MKMVIIQPVDKPKSFKDLGFTEDEYKSAVRVGPKKVPYAVAREAVDLSNGLYKMKAEKEPVEVEIKAKMPEDMTSAELVAEMTAFGKPPRKQMARKDVVAFIHKLRAEAAEMIMDDDDDE